jgi:hypothetical protein
MFDKKDLLIFRYEIQALLSHKRKFHFAFLLILGIFLIAWIYPVGLPFVPVMIVALCGLELQFNNILFRDPKEFEAYQLFPVSWKCVILMKNLSTAVLTVFISLLSAMVLLRFSPATIRPVDLVDLLLYLLTVLFPLIQIGNSQSVSNPRRFSGMQTNDFIEVVWMLVNIGIVSVPYFIFIELLKMPLLSVLYGIITIAIWLSISVNKTANHIINNSFEICSSQ